MNDQVQSRQSSEALVEDKLQLHTLYGQARLQFIQKVFFILSVQVASTVIAVLITIYSQTFHSFQQNYAFLFIAALIAWVIGYVMLVHGKKAKQYPYNIAFLISYTIGQSYSISYLCGTYVLPDFTGIIFMACIMTLCIIIGCAIYAYKTSNDFTTTEGARIVSIISFSILVVFAFFDDQKILHVLLCSLGSALYGMHIIINIQTMIGSNQRQLSIDDFVVCALILYTNILQLFTCILLLLSGNRRNVT